MHAADTHLDAETKIPPTRVLPNFGIAGYTNSNPTPADADVETLTDDLAMEFMGEYLTGDTWAEQSFFPEFLFGMRKRLMVFPIAIVGNPRRSQPTGWENLRQWFVVLPRDDAWPSLYMF